MKKIFLLFVFLSLVVLCSCNFTDRFQSGNIEPQNLRDFVELNGEDSAHVFKLRLEIEGEWSFTGSMNLELPNGSVAYVKEAVYYGTLLVGIEFTSEKIAERIKNIYKLYGYSYYRKDNYIFTTYLGCFVLFYGLDGIEGDQDVGTLINEPKTGKKILLSIKKNYPVVDDVIIIDGYDILVHQCLTFHERKSFEKVIIGNDVEILYYGALIFADFEVLEFTGNVKEIHGAMTAGNETFKYTVIPDSVTYVGKNAFFQGNIYCEHDSKPTEWDDNFAVENAKVYWAGEWEYDDNGVPHPIEKVTSDNITEEV